MKIITILTAAALGLTATASLAQTSVVVRYADLDLGNAQGQATLARRLGMAATEVCGVSNGLVDLATKQAQSSCRRTAMANAKLAIEHKNAPQIASR